jgi:tRNA (cmo5U34)-methyltransferase
MTQDPPRDQLYAHPRQDVSDFRFDESVAAIFPDMINRSVPGYATVISVIGVIAAEYAQAGSRIYDLGCSLGAATLSMLRQVDTRDIEFVGVDNSEAMLRRCREYVLKDGHEERVYLVCASLQDVPIEDASVVVLNFTLQFIPPEQRFDILKAIYEGMRPGGVLVLSEKICFEDAATNESMIELHHDFKRLHGYSDLEISQKRQALENVLLPETRQTHMDRLEQAGFTRVESWFQCLNFVSLLAHK